MLLWNSVYEWAEDKNIKKEYKDHLFLTKKSFELSLNKGVTKYFNIFAATLKDPKILKTRYRFTYLNR